MHKYNQSAVLLLLLIMFNLFTGCGSESEEDLTEKDKLINNDIEESYQSEVVDYVFNNLDETQIYPIRKYIDATGKEIIFYGKYNIESNTINRITQIVYQDNLEHYVLSFNKENDLVSLYNHDLSTGLVKDKIYIKNENNKYYIQENDNTTELTNHKNISFGSSQTNEFESVTSSLFNQNNNIINHLLSLNSTKNNKAFKENKADFIGAIILGVVIGSIVNALADKVDGLPQINEGTHINFGLSLITNNTKIQTNNYEDLPGNIADCDFNKPSRKGAITQQKYTCSYSPEFEKARKENALLILALCGNKICVLDCKGEVNGSAYFNECGGCIDGSLEIIEGDFTDPRDGYTYKTVTIGHQTWFAENLRYEGAGLAYETAEQNALYGRRYDFSDATNKTSPICPNGWHVPTDDEWTILELETGIPREKLGKELKDCKNWNGVNTFGLSFIPGGVRGGGGLSTISIGYNGDYWTSSAAIPYIDSRYPNVYVRSLRNDDSFERNKAMNYSEICVRCLKD